MGYGAVWPQGLHDLSAGRHSRLIGIRISATNGYPPVSVSGGGLADGYKDIPHTAESSTFESRSLIVSSNTRSFHDDDISC